MSNPEKITIGRYVLYEQIAQGGMAAASPTPSPPKQSALRAKPRAQKPVSAKPKATSPAPHKAATRKPAAEPTSDCDPPYVIDARGKKKLKMECL